MNQSKSALERETELHRIKVLSLTEGFVHSSILFALLNLNIFEIIGKEGRTLEDLASTVNAKPDTLARLLNGGVSLGLLESDEGRIYRASPVASSVLLPSAGENYLGNYIRNMDFIRAAMGKLDEAILRSGPTIDPSTHVGADKKHTREFALAMHNSASVRGKELAQFLDTSSCMSLLDLGCGPGTYSFHLARRNPDLKLYLVDREEVLEVAKEIQARYEVKNEVHYIPLDIVEGQLRGSYDIILISNTLHVLGEEASRTLIKRLYSNVSSGGSLIIQAQFLKDDHMGPPWPIMLDLMKLCITENGRNHSVGETKQWLEEAGFTSIQYNAMTAFNPNSYLRAYKQ
jgi:SAM-dependent methyltransferase